MGERLPALTGLRFVAAAAVVAVHMDYWFAFTGPVHAVARNGNLGVTFFFVLSGFVLTAGYRRGRVRDFYRRRFARVYPLHLVTWTLALAFFPVVGAGWDYTRGLVLLNGLWAAFGHPGQLNTPAWSLTCEAVFYALFPLLIPWVLRLSPSGLRRGMVASWVAMIAISGVLFALLPVALADTLAGRLPIVQGGYFVAGMMLARLVASGWAPARSHTLIGCMLLAPLALSVPSGVRGLLAFPMVLIVVGWGAKANRSLLASPVAVRMGEQSYALFLSHIPVYVVLAPLLVTPTFKHGLVLTGAFLLVAALMHHGIEKPLERRLRGGQVRVRTG